MRSLGGAVAVLFACSSSSKPSTAPATVEAPAQAPTEAPAEEGTPECEPGRCLPDISATIQKHRAEARACYDKARKKHPTIEGRLIINFAIDATGAVAEAAQGSQDDQISEPEVVDCVVAVIQKIKFRASASGRRTRAYHRFEFAPR